MASEEGIKNSHFSPDNTAPVEGEKAIANFSDLVALIDNNHEATEAGCLSVVPLTTNAGRAALAAMSLVAFAERTGQDLFGTEPVREIVVDLLANLMHLCDQLGVTDVEPFLSLNESAWRHFITEITDENPIPF